MKTKLRIIKWMLVLVLGMGVSGAWGQTSQTLTQDVCPGSEPYRVTPGDVSNDFLWSISTGTSGLNWTITDPTAASTNIIWANTATPVTYRVTFTETNGNSCVTEVFVDVTVYPEPLKYNVTGGGSFCAGASGLVVGLFDSQKGVNYQLQLDGVNTGAPVAGTDAAISFDLQTAAGTYTVVATSISANACTSAMTGSVAITVEPSPTAYAVTGGGSFCAGASGLVVGLFDSQTGVNYQLQLDGVNTGAPVAGTDAAISFGLQTAAGTYTVVATGTSANACTSAMTGSVTISINPVPNTSAIFHN